MKVVCFDTNVAIWAIHEQATPGQEYMIERTQRFIQQLDANKDKIMIPSVVLSEFLLPIPAEHHALTLNLMQRSFIIAPFDLQASAVFAKIWQIKHAAATIQELRQQGFTRTQLKADCMIVATAIAKGAGCIYSHDKDVRKFSEGQIDCYDIPDIPGQLALFEE
jgi:predicted nucleic acid-binding protein